MPRVLGGLQGEPEEDRDISALAHLGSLLVLAGHCLTQEAEMAPPAGEVGALKKLFPFISMLLCTGMRLQ